MYVKIKNCLTGEEVMISTSKLTTISQVRDDIFKKMKVAKGTQRLLFLGKQLEDEDDDGTKFTLFDYNVKVNDLIQLFVRKPLSEKTSQNLPSQVEAGNPTKEVKVEAKAEIRDAVSDHLKLDEDVDSRDEKTGAWFEAKVERITCNDKNPGFDKLTYHVRYEGYEDAGLFKVRLEQLRPRAKTNLAFLDLDLKHEVMVNYNIEQPEERGFWYDAVVTAWRSTSTRKVLEVTIQGRDGKKTEKCNIVFRDEVFAVEKVSYPTTPASGRATASAPSGGSDRCTCKGKPTVNCRKCGCGKCGGRDDEQNHILCDECNSGYHLKCVGLFSLPPENEEWFCPLCLNKDDIVGGSVKMTKKKIGEGRDWGQGFACQGRTKECTTVPKNHFGPIPGIEVGMSWLQRIQVSEEGVHRPPVAGISGRAKEGSQSIVLAGGYEDDEDNGESFYYTGAGGRDLSGNKRTAEQSFDQVLTLTNAAIAMNCKASFNTKTGGDAGDKWREGKPIRVVRSYKGKKHSQYAPDEGNRYDGLYKVVKYWPEKGKKGFIVWRYLFRRDDPSPAPWTKEGKERMEEQGLSLVYPPGYLEHKAQQEKERKRKAGQNEEDAEDEEEGDEAISAPAKKKAKTIYSISAEWKEMIQKDEQNVKIWQDVQSKKACNKKELTDYIEEQFNCIICQDIVYKPATTPCGHNFCMECLERSFQSGKKDCPSCRAELSEDFKKFFNKDLRSALQVIFPGYETGR